MEKEQILNIYNTGSNTSNIRTFRKYLIPAWIVAASITATKRTEKVNTPNTFSRNPLSIILPNP